MDSGHRSAMLEDGLLSMQQYHPLKNDDSRNETNDGFVCLKMSMCSLEMSVMLNSIKRFSPTSLKVNWFPNEMTNTLDPTTSTQNFNSNH